MRADLARILAKPIAHRGLHDRANGVIENSNGAADAAIANGFGIECDVQISSDGEAVVFHDDTLDRLTGSAGPVEGHTAEALTQVTLRDSADTIPALPTFFARIAGRVPLVIEIKSRFDNDMRLTDRVAAIVASYRGPVAMKSFDAAIVQRCRSLGVPCPIGQIGPLDLEGPFPDITLEDIDFLSWNIQALPALRDRYPGIPAMSWTVRSPEQQAIATKLGAQIVFERFTPG